MSMERLYECLKYEYKYGYEVEYFWISGVLLVVVSVLGLIGNTLSFAIFLRATFRKDIIYQLFMIMAFFDTVFIISLGIAYGYYSMACTDNYKTPIEHIATRISYLGLYGSIYSTLMVSIERYLGICHWNLTYKRKIWIYLIPILIITIGFNLPSFFDIELYRVNGTIDSSHKSWNDDTYRYRYYFWASIFVEDIIPLPIITLLNICIVREVRRNTMSIGTNKRSKRIEEVTKTIIIIVSVFVLVRFIGLLLNILLHFGSKKPEFRDKWTFFVPIYWLLLITNSSINFLVYSMVGTKFRQEFLQYFLFK